MLVVWYTGRYWWSLSKRVLVVWYTGRCWWSLSKRDRCWWYGILGGVGGLCLRETGVGGMVYWEVLVVSV